MTRRTLLNLLLAIPTAACNELRRYHSSVAFELSPDTPTAGQPIEVRFLYLDEAEPGAYTVVLMRTESREEVDQSDVADAASRPSLTPPAAGEYTVEFRKQGRMVAHRRITVR